LLLKHDLFTLCLSVHLGAGRRVGHFLIFGHGL
jgi:hypothetical protein